MQLFALIVWLALNFALAKGVNFFAKRPLMNPWVWFAASYGVLYVLSIVIGVARGNQNFAYLAGYYLPVTSVAIALGVWRAPKWRANNLMAMAFYDRKEPVVKTVDTER